MKNNMGNTDRLLRAITAAILYVLVYMEVVTGPLKVVFGLVGMVFILTALFGYCPLYRLVGLNTCRTKKIDTE